jgi:hypothetical protein
MTKEATKRTDTDPAVNSNSIHDTTKQDIAAALSGDPAILAAQQSTGPVPALDGMSVADLRLDQNFVETAGVKKLLTTVPVRKPSPQDYNRVHPDPTFRSVVGLIELKDDREIYLLSPAMVQELPGEFYAATLYTAINRQGVVFLWPVRLPAKDGKQLEWHRSAADHAERAMKVWARIKSNMSLGAYEIIVATKAHDDPVWPEGVTFQNLIEIAFRDRFINRVDHPVAQRLRGLV